MTIYLDQYLTVNTTRGLRSWVSHSESSAPSKSIMISFNCNTWGHVLRVFFFFFALLVSNLLAPTWSVALMKTSYHTVIWMNLKILEGCSACWTKLSNYLCAWISWVAFFRNNNKDPRLYLICFGKYSCLDKFFSILFFQLHLFKYAWVKPFPMDKSMYVSLNMWVIEHNILFPNGLSLTKGK